MLDVKKRKKIVSELTCNHDNTSFCASSAKPDSLAKVYKDVVVSGCERYSQTQAWTLILKSHPYGCVVVIYKSVRHLQVTLLYNLLQNHAKGADQSEKKLC